MHGFKTKQIQLAINNIITIMGMPPSECFFIFTTPGKKEFATEVFNYLKAKGLNVNLIITVNDMGESITTYKKLLHNIANRFGIIILFEPQYSQFYFDVFGRPDLGLKLNPDYFFTDYLLPLDSLIRLYGIDLNELLKFKANLLNELQEASLIEVTTTAGTNISIHPRSWGEISGMEVGEIFTAPRECLTDGTIVVDGCVYSDPPRIPFTLEIKEGKVRNISSLDRDNKKQNMVRNDLLKDKNSNVVAEFGIGINPNAKQYGGIMEAECARGTCHFGFGNNLEYGGKNRSCYHFDLVVSKPDIVVDGKKICANGNYDRL